MSTPERPCSELLPWLFLSESQRLVVNKDSSLMALFLLDGVDAESVDSHGVMDAALQLDEALRSVAANNVRVWTRADRRQHKAYAHGVFENKTAGEIDRLWGDSFMSGRAYKNSQYIAVAMGTQKRARSVAELMRDLIDDGEPVWAAFGKAIWSKFRSSPKESIGFETREQLQAETLRFEQNVIAPMMQKLYMFRLRRLEGDELCGQLRSAVSVSVPSPIAVNEYSYLDAALSDTWIDNSYRDFLVLTGATEQYVAVLTLKDAPRANQLAALDTLMALPMRISIANCWRSSSVSVAIKDLKDARTFDELRRMQFKDMVRKAVRNETELVAADNTPTSDVGVAAEAHVEALNDSREAWGYLACSIIVYADDPTALERNVERVQQLLERRQINFLREREGAISGFAVGIPGNVLDPVRWFHVEASNVTDLAPVITLDPGSPGHPHFGGREHAPPHAWALTRYATMQYLNYHHGALGHTIYIGPSRNGKTMQKMFMTSQLQKYPNARAVIFDKDYSCEAPTLLHDGTCYDLTPGATKTARMNPLSFAKTAAGKTFLVGWLDRLMSARGPRLTDREIEAVSQAINRTAGVPGFRLTSLVSQLSPDLSERLAPWCQGGVWGSYFDHEVDEMSFDTMTCFEVGGLIAANLTDVLRAFTDYVFFRVEMMVNDVPVDGLGPTEIYFEEAGFLLEDPIFADKAVDYLTTLAKKQAYLVMTAQSPEPFFRNERLRAAVRDNVATIVFLPNKKASQPELARMYKDVFGVNENHLELIQGATPKREYCIWQQQAGVFRVAVMPFSKEIVARLMSDKQSRAVLAETYDPRDPEWKTRYISEILKLI